MKSRKNILIPGRLGILDIKKRIKTSPMAATLASHGKGMPEKLYADKAFSVNSPKYNLTIK